MTESISADMQSLDKFPHTHIPTHWPFTVYTNEPVLPVLNWEYCEEVWAAIPASYACPLHRTEPDCHNIDCTATKANFRIWDDADYRGMGWSSIYSGQVKVGLWTLALFCKLYNCLFTVTWEGSCSVCHIAKPAKSNNTLTHALHQAWLRLPTMLFYNEWATQPWLCVYTRPSL